MLSSNHKKMPLIRLLGAAFLSSSLLSVTAQAAVEHSVHTPDKPVQPASHQGRYAIYVSNAEGGTVSVLTLNEKDKTLKPLETVKAGKSIAPQVVSPDGKVLYVVDVDKNAIVSYDIDPHTGALKHRQTTAVPAQYVYLSIDASGRYALGASYFGNKVQVFRVSDLAKSKAVPISTVDHIPHAHSVILSRDGHFAYVASLGLDRLFAFALNDEGKLSLINSVSIEKNFGPRHQYLSRNGRRLFVVSEFSGRVAELKRDTQTGRISLLRISKRPTVLNHLQDGFADAADSKRGTQGLRWAADLHTSPNEKFFYLSERTSSNIITLDHNLEYVGAIGTSKQPRGFNITPDGRFLISSGERSPDIDMYQINKVTGKLTPVAKSKAGGGANWIGIYPLR